MRDPIDVGRNLGTYTMKMKKLVGLLAAISISAVVLGCQIQAETPEAATGDPEIQFEERVFAKMREPIHWKVTDETLDAFFDRLHNELGIPVVVDQPAFEAAGVRTSEKFSQNFEGEPRGPRSTWFFVNSNWIGPLRAMRS